MESDAGFVKEILRVLKDRLQNKFRKRCLVSRIHLSVRTVVSLTDQNQLFCRQWHLLHLSSTESGGQVDIYLSVDSGSSGRGGAGCGCSGTPSAGRTCHSPCRDSGSCVSPCAETGDASVWRESQTPRCTSARQRGSQILS